MRYSLVCKTADGRRVYIQLYGSPGKGEEAWIAAKSVLRPSVELEWGDADDDRDPVWWTLACATLFTASIGVVGALAVMIINMAGLVSDQFLLDGRLPTSFPVFAGIPWTQAWTRTCLALWPVVTVIALTWRSLRAPGP